MKVNMDRDNKKDSDSKKEPLYPESLAIWKRIKELLPWLK